jgi:hypothetical protein
MREHGGVSQADEPQKLSEQAARWLEERPSRIWMVAFIAGAGLTAAILALLSAVSPY